MDSADADEGPGAAVLAVRRYLRLAAGSAALLLGCLLGWAMMTQLSGAVLAQGRFVVSSHVKAVQHPDGGVVGEILVQEGDRVQAGQLLIRLDDTQLAASVAMLSDRLDELRARAARLEAEASGATGIAFPPGLLDRAGDPHLAGILEEETSLLRSRREARDGQRAQLEERITQYRLQAEGLEAQQRGYERALAVLDDELAGLRQLRSDGLVTVERLNSLDRDAASYEGARGEAIAGRAEAAGRMAEMRLQILQIESDMRVEVGQQLQEVRAQIAEYRERLVATRDRLARSQITAPQTGVVHELSVHAPGAVISPAEAVLRIVPTDDPLQVEAQVAPADIDQIYPGQAVFLRLSAMNQRVTPEVPATVTGIAAEVSEDPRSGASFYRVTVLPDAGPLADRAVDLAVPGMPAEVFLRTEARSALSYVLKPLEDQFERAFRAD